MAGLAIALSLLSCSKSGAGNSSATGAQKLTPFTSAEFTSELYLPDYIAKDKGLDKKHGLDLNFVFPDSGAAAAQLMLAGQVQGWVTDPLIVMTAAAKGQDIRLAGISAPALQYEILVSKKGNWPPATASFNDKVSALKGKNIGVSGIGAGTDHALLIALHQVGLGETAVNRVGIGQQQAAIGQLQAGRIDAFVSFSLAGNAVIEQQTGATLYLSLGTKEAPPAVRDIPLGSLAVSGAFAQKNPDAVKRWLAMEQEGIDYMRSNPKESADVLNDHLFKGAQLDLAKQVVQELLAPDGIYAPGVAPAGLKVPHQSFDAGVGALVDLGIVKQGQLNYDDVVIPMARASK